MWNKKIKKKHNILSKPKNANEIRWNDAHICDNEKIKQTNECIPN